MNYSYVMGVNDITELKDNGFEIEAYGNSYGISFSNDKIPIFEEYICNNLNNGFWNEYLGKDKVFIFKFNDGSIKKYILDSDNESVVLDLCREFANCDFVSIDDMLSGNEFYLKKYYN